MFAHVFYQGDALDKYNAKGMSIYGESWDSSGAGGGTYMFYIRYTYISIDNCTHLSSQSSSLHSYVFIMNLSHVCVWMAGTSIKDLVAIDEEDIRTLQIEAQNIVTQRKAEEVRYSFCVLLIRACRFFLPNLSYKHTFDIH